MEDVVGWVRGKVHSVEAGVGPRHTYNMWKDTHQLSHFTDKTLLAHTHTRTTNMTILYHIIDKINKKNII